MNFRDKADVAIIGGGIGGIMTAYRLLEKNPELKVSVIERGHDIEKKGMPHAHKKDGPLYKMRYMRYYGRYGRRRSFFRR